MKKRMILLFSILLLSLCMIPSSTGAKKKKCKHTSLTGWKCDKTHYDITMDVKKCKKCGAIVKTATCHGKDGDPWDGNQDVYWSSKPFKVNKKLKRKWFSTCKRCKKNKFKKTVPASWKLSDVKNVD